jgi:hypothetical protein
MFIIFQNVGDVKSVGLKVDARKNRQSRMVYISDTTLCSVKSAVLSIFSLCIVQCLLTMAIF